MRAPVTDAHGPTTTIVEGLCAPDERRAVSRAPALQLLAALGFLAATVVVAWLGGRATTAGMDWYDSLDRPWFTPPDATFGIVWTVLYVLVALAGWLAWRAAGPDRPSATDAWAIQMALNLSWTVAFFGLQSPWMGQLVIIALIAAVAFDVMVSWRVSRIAGALLVPYLLWCCFAAALNIGILTLN